MELHALNSTRQKSKKTSKRDSNSKKLIEIEEVKDTPFSLMKEGGEWYLILGQYKLTTGCTKEQAQEEAQRKDWNRMMQVMHIMIEKHEQVREIYNQSKITK